jgi:hypothetical protein
MIKLKTHSCAKKELDGKRTAELRSAFGRDSLLEDVTNPEAKSGRELQ